jgi:hypothetical protein
MNMYMCYFTMYIMFSRHGGFSAGGSSKLCRLKENNVTQFTILMVK